MTGAELVGALDAGSELGCGVAGVAAGDCPWEPIIPPHIPGIIMHPLNPTTAARIRISRAERFIVVEFFGVG